MTMIAKLSLASAMVLALGAGAAQARQQGGAQQPAADQYSMTIRNTNATMSIERVWVAPAGIQGTPWEEVSLNHPILPNEDSTFTVPASTGRCFYDVRLRFSDGGDATTGNVNVCRHDVLTAH